MTMIWTEIEIEKLHFLWAQGFRARDIAATFGISRNAICGKLFRLGLKNDREGEPVMPKPRRVRTKEPTSRVARLRPSMPKLTMVEPDPRTGQAPVADPRVVYGPTHFNDACASQCRFALWGTHEHTGLICGERVVLGSSYCPAHEARVRTPLPVRRRWVRA